MSCARNILVALALWSSLSVSIPRSAHGFAPHSLQLPLSPAIQTQAGLTAAAFITPPSTTTSNSINTSNSKKRTIGMNTSLNLAANSNANASGTGGSGVVDPQADIEGTIEVLDNSPCDVMLVNVDPAKNMDKYYILQLIQVQCPHCHKELGYAVYMRWGRTGTSGQDLVKKFDADANGRGYNDAVTCFQDKFHEKTGLSWEHRTHPTIGGKYRFIQQNYTEKQHGYMSAKWQYWVDDGVDGKSTGWYDYVPTGSIMVEQLFHENSINSSLTNRLVESGTYTYDVDLKHMIQTNVSHPNRTSRKIRRYPAETVV